MDEPLVSVIVGVYNKERFVGECLRSVLAQTYRNWELIVVDDASTDGSLAEVERVLGGESRAKIIRRRENSGHPGIARNQALREAQGEYVAFLDADDVWKPGKLAVQTAWMAEHPEYPLSHAACEEIDEQGRVLRVRHDGVLPPSGNCLRELFHHCFICTSTVMVRRDFGEPMGWFTEEPGYECGEDYDFFIRSAKEGGVGVLPGIWAGYRNVSASITHRTENWKNTPTDYQRKVFFLRRKELWAGCMPIGEMKTEVWKSAIENCQYWRARQEWPRAWWFARQALRRAPFSVGAWRQAAGVVLHRR